VIKIPAPKKTLRVKTMTPINIGGTKLAVGEVIESYKKYVQTWINSGCATITDEKPRYQFTNGTLEILIDTTPLPPRKEDVKQTIIEKLLLKKRDRATELMVDYLEKKEDAYTTRDDINPEVWIYEEGVYKPNGITKLKEEIREILGDVYTTTFANQVVNKIMLDTTINQEELFGNKYLEEIAVENGLLNIITGELEKFNPKRIHFNKLNIKYEPGKECPNIIRFFKDVLKNEEDLPVIQELIGYLLYKEYNIEKAFMLVGTGRNGKGKTLDLIKRFLNPENCTSIPLQQFEKNIFSLSEVHNKLVNISGDLDKKALQHTGSFKQLTGRDLITGARKFKTNIYFENFAKMIFATNDLPLTYDLSPAFFMRWIILEFPYTFVSEKEYEEENNYAKKQWLKIRDPDIIKRITTPDEMSGMLNWALEGLHRLLKQKDFSYSKSVDEVKTLWLRKSDSFTAYCMDSLEEEYGSYISKNELRHAYNGYCKKHGLKAVTDNSLKNTLTVMFGVTEGRISDLSTGRIRVWEGVKFRDKEPKYLEWV